MDYKQIKYILENNDYKEVIKAIFSFESGLEKESNIDELSKVFLDSKMPNFLDEELHFKTLELLKDE
ncbi:hypothetical protein BUY99_13650 [Staphylococcus gallinarum]|uniref:hypothetical protein n=1 Tax=Staphylococcus TaxID=1279 RepID=UPI000E6A1991|nr:hypothetical protein [Staphylococcus gallinarum]RIL18488.1 hypothetical protein BUY99_13650 [Staphylococcus gallinarum]